MMNSWIQFINFFQPILLRSSGAFIAVFASSIVLGTRKGLPPFNALVGAGSWMIYDCLQSLGISLFLTTLAAGIFLALCAQLGARYFKLPVTLITIPGLYPLVPGTSLYMSVHAFLEADGRMAAFMAVQTLIIALAIALSLLFVETIFVLISAKKRRKRL